MDQWEYKVVTFDRFLKRRYTMEEFTKDLNQLGDEGWELASSSIPTNTAWLIAVFKRKKSKEE